jgi:hypothetical protein
MKVVSLVPSITEALFDLGLTKKKLSEEQNSVFILLKK